MSKPNCNLTQERLRELLHYEPLTGVFTRLVSTANWAKVGDVAGGKGGKDYLQIGIDNRDYKAHRLAWFYMTGAWPIDQIDHIDGNPVNNRIENLREATNSVNKQNMRKARSDNKSGLLGVGKNGKKWRAVIGVDGKNKHIGYFDTPELAHAAYLDAKRVLHVGCTI